MRPFGCLVTILNTLDPLGKFQGKVDEGFLVGYSVCSKAFMVFNSRTRIVQETLHVNFMENKPNVTGSGPAWLFDIDSLSQTMNYHPVLTENQTNSKAGFQDTEKAGEEGTHTYVLFPVLSDGSTNPKNNKDAHTDGKEHDDDIQKSDETPSVLKTFIIGLENLLSLKVKIIRCDNGTEFKNSNLNQFCGIHFSLFLFRLRQLTLLAQNRVLATKPHNKTPYELLHGRLPSIGFMRPFGCPVTILNTLDPLGKFQGKVDEGFLVGYSVCNKAFRVFNSRARIVQETLHVNFLENKPNVAGSGPAWLFDIDSLSQTMNYHPNNNKDAHADGKEHDDDIQKFVSPNIHSSSSGAQIRKQGDKSENKDK
nr:hypothetical protein [Tanacetum cinerariifolium]